MFNMTTFILLLGFGCIIFQLDRLTNKITKQNK